jgi:transposase
MGRILTVSLSDAQRAALEKGAKYGSTPTFRLRCQAILLKSDARTSVEVAKELNCCEMAVNNWMKRYQANGIEGLKNRKGQGRNPILQTDTDLAKVRLAVQANRQKLSLAKAQLEQELGKEFSLLTLKRFLKKTVVASNGCEND